MEGRCHLCIVSLSEATGRAKCIFFWEEKEGGVYHGVLVLVLSIGIRGFSFLLYFTLLYIDTQEHQSSSSIIILQYLSIYRSRFETRKNQGLHKRITCSKLMITKSKFVHLFVIMF